jgi:hypothetical protein
MNVFVHCNINFVMKFMTYGSQVVKYPDTVQNLLGTVPYRTRQLGGTNDVLDLTSKKSGTCK